MNPPCGHCELQAVRAIRIRVREGLLESLHNRAELPMLEQEAAHLPMVSRQAGGQGGDWLACLLHSRQQERHARVAVAAEMHGWEDDAAVRSLPSNDRLHRDHSIDDVGFTDRRPVYLATMRGCHVVDD